MFLLCSFRSENSRKKANQSSQIRSDTYKDHDLWKPVTLHSSKDNPSKFNIDCSNPGNNSVDRSRGKRRNKASSLSDRILRVASSCIFHPLVASWKKSSCNGGVDDCSEEEEEEEEEDDDADDDERAELLEGIMDEVLGAVSAIQRVCLKQQAMQKLRDPEKARAANMEVATELRRLLVLQQRYKKCAKGMKMEEVKVIEEKSKMLTKKLSLILGSYQSRSSCRQWTTSTVPELFETTMRQVRDASQSFASLFVFLTSSARWDISAVVRSITAATTTSATATIGTTLQTRYALDSHLTYKIFQGFDHGTFLVDDSTIHSPHHRLRQYQEMKNIDPIDFLGAFPNCSFSKFCSKKYRSIVHRKMEDSFFGKQQRQAMAGEHPRTEFYREFLGLAKAVWLLHLLSFSLESAPVPFAATRGTKFHPWFMESVVSWVGGGQAPMGHNIVGFPVSPGFKLGNGSIVKARVYLVGKC